MRKIKQTIAIKSIMLIFFGSLAFVAVPVLAETGSDGDSQLSEAAKNEAEAKLEAAKKEAERQREAGV